jgi:hypothetical protein
MLSRWTNTDEDIKDIKAEVYRRFEEVPFNTDNRNLKKEVVKRRMFLLPDLASTLKGEPPTKTIPKAENQADLDKMANRPTIPFPPQSNNNNNNNNNLPMVEEGKEDIIQQSTEPKIIEHKVTPPQTAAQKSAGKSKSPKQIPGQLNLADLLRGRKRKWDETKAEAQALDPDNDADPPTKKHKKNIDTTNHS